MTQAVSKWAEFKSRCLEDTGFLCRHVLGHNYDEEEDPRPGMPPRKTNVGTGGVRSDGVYKEITDFLDGRSSRSRYLHLEAPRGTYKSTILQGYIIRHIVRNPNIRILYGMKTAKKALEKTQGIASHFKSRNSKFRKVFGDLRGEKWSEGSGQLNVKGRTIEGMQEFTFQIFGRDQLPTGGHYDIIILDDLVDKDNITAEGIAKTREVFNVIDPLLAHGGIMIVIGTRYCDGDLYGTILEEMSGLFESLVLDAGVECTEKDGKVVLEPNENFPVFPALTLDLLKKKLASMGGVVDFSAQYLNRIVAGVTQPFLRTYFRVKRRDPGLLDSLTAFVLTDTATSENEEGCHSAIALAGLDVVDDAYLLDLEVGHWQPHTFVQRFFDLIARWSSQVYIHAQLFEAVSYSTVFQAFVENEARHREMRLNTIGLKRETTANAKRRRIARLQPRLMAGRFFVCDSVPRVFIDLQETKELFNPEGHKPEDGVPEPSGELVDQFIRWPRFPRNDIADALADIDVMDSQGIRVCKHIPGHTRARRRARGTRPGEILRRRPGSLTPGSARRHPSGGSYVDRIYERISRAGSVGGHPGRTS